MKLFKAIFETKWVQGYQYLDHCGKALVRLEKELPSGWIASEPKPTGGSIKNIALEMFAVFDSYRFTIVQNLSPNRDELTSNASKIFDILRSTFEIEEINVPVIRIIAQKGFDEELEATKYIQKFNYITIQSSLLELMSGTINAIEYTVCTEKNEEWLNIPVQIRRRFNAKVIKQEKTDSFDDRIMQKANQLPKNQRDAMKALINLRKKVPGIPTIAAQIDLEQLIEGQLPAKSFDLPEFIEQGWQWAESIFSKHG